MYGTVHLINVKYTIVTTGNCSFHVQFLILDSINHKLMYNGKPYKTTSSNVNPEENQIVT